MRGVPGTRAVCAAMIGATMDGETGRPPRWIAMRLVTLRRWMAGTVLSSCGPFGPLRRSPGIGLYQCRRNMAQPTRSCQDPDRLRQRRSKQSLSLSLAGCVRGLCREDLGERGIRRPRV